MISFFKRMFAQAEPSGPEEVRLRARDCHTHVVPGVDDGSRNVEESLDMLRLLVDAGARTIVATPHIFPARYPNEPGPLRTAFDGLRRARDEAGIEVELELGAEHFLDDDLVERIRQGAILSFGDEKYVLFECQTGPDVPAQIYDVVRELKRSGFTPLLAHVERYRWLREYEDGLELCEDLRSAGVRFQVNRTVGKVNLPGVGPRGNFIAKLLHQGWIDEVGSDLHRATAEGRPYAVSAAEVG